VRETRPFAESATARAGPHPMGWVGRKGPKKQRTSEKGEEKFGECVEPRRRGRRKRPAVAEAGRKGKYASAKRVERKGVKVPQSADQGNEVS